MHNRSDEGGKVKVSELIIRLQKVDPNAEVKVRKVPSDYTVDAVYEYEFQLHVGDEVIVVSKVKA